jgi:hypothetical protein
MELTLVETMPREQNIPCRHFVALVVIVFVAGLPLSSCRGGTGQSPPRLSFVEQFDFLWQTFDREYPYFIHKNIDWPALRATYRPRAQAALSQGELVQILREMLSNLHDLHVTLIDPSGLLRSSTFTPAHFVNFDSNVWQNQYLARAIVLRRTPGFTTAFLDGKAYIAIQTWSMAQLSIADLDAAIEDFRNAPSIIIDVRNNPGGSDTLAFQFAGRFADRVRTARFVQFRNGPAHSDFGALIATEVAPRGAWQFTKPTQVLIGRGCASSCEDFVLGIKEFPHVTLVGDLTIGSSGNPGFFPLSDGWQFGVSRWIAFSAQMQIIEDVGIAPAILVNVAPADFASGRDPVLDFALTRAAAPWITHDAVGSRVKENLGAT